VTEIAVNDFEIYAAIAEGLETISSIIVQFAELEKPLSARSQLKSEISRTIVRVYLKVLKFLAASRRYFDENPGREAFCSGNMINTNGLEVKKIKNMFKTLKSTVKDFVEAIPSMTAEMYRLSNEVRWEGMATESRRLIVS